jgi:hypothetical protein
MALTGMEWMSLAGMGLQAIGTLTSAKAQLDQGAAKQQIAQYNAQAQEQRAQQLEQEAEARAAIQGRANQRGLASIRSAYAGAGVDVNQGTPLEVMSDAAAELELQKQMILYGGKVGAYNARVQGNIDLMMGNYAQQAAATGANATLLTGATRIGQQAVSMWGYPKSETKPQTIPDVGTGTGYTY